MSSMRTADEVKKDCVSVMGQELGLLYNDLTNELVTAYSRWEEYVEIFGKKESRVELANRAAPYFFHVIQDFMLEGTFLHLARLTDRITTAGNENLSIRALPPLICDASLKQNVLNLIEIADTSTSFCRDWRNRRIAHRDKLLVLGESAKPLEIATREKVKEALTSIAAVLNSISLDYFESTTYFEGMGNDKGALSLLYVLADGLEMKKQNESRKYDEKKPRSSRANLGL